MPLHRGNSLHVLLFLSSSSLPLSRATFHRFLLLLSSSSSSSSSSSLPLKLLYSPLLCFDLSSLRTSILSLLVVRRGSDWMASVDSITRFPHKLEILREIPGTGSRRIRMDPESSRSLSSLINVVSLLIYRRVAGEPTNEIRRYHARSDHTWDTLAGFAR